MKLTYLNMSVVKLTFKVQNTKLAFDFLNNVLYISFCDFLLGSSSVSKFVCSLIDLDAKETGIMSGRVTVLLNQSWEIRLGVIINIVLGQPSLQLRFIPCRNIVIAEDLALWDRNIRFSL
jgi:hypothetical protein